MLARVPQKRVKHKSVLKLHKQGGNFVSITRKEVKTKKTKEANIKQIQTGSALQLEPLHDKKLPVLLLAPEQNCNK